MCCVLCLHVSFLWDLFIFIIVCLSFFSFSCFLILSQFPFKFSFCLSHSLFHTLLLLLLTYSFFHSYFIISPFYCFLLYSFPSLFLSFSLAPNSACMWGKVRTVKNKQTQATHVKSTVDQYREYAHVQDVLPAVYVSSERTRIDIYVLGFRVSYQLNIWLQFSHPYD